MKGGGESWWRQLRQDAAGREVEVAHGASQSMSNESCCWCVTLVEVEVVSWRSEMTRHPLAHPAVVKLEIEFVVTAAGLSSCDSFVEAMAAVWADSQKMTLAIDQRES